jgi:hypothetical protein
MARISRYFSIHIIYNYNNSPDDISPWFFSAPLRTFAWFFFSAFEDLRLRFTGTLESSRIRKLYEPSPVPTLYVGTAGLRTFLVGFHSFPASLMATPPSPFQTSLLHDRVGTSNSAVLTDLARERADAAMYMRSTLGCGTLDAPNLALLVSLLIKLRRSARGAGVLLQRAPGRPGRPASLPLPRLMLTYDMNIPVIYL